MRTWLLAGIVLLVASGCLFNPSDPVTGQAYADLRSPDPRVRWNASLAVGQRRDFDAVPYLIENLRNDDFTTRAGAQAGLLLIYHGPGRKGFDYPPPFPYDSVEPGPVQEAGIEAWEKWWATDGKKLAQEAQSQNNSGRSQ